MRYLFCGAASYAQTGGNMRCVHARLVREGGLDVDKFDMVAQMLRDVMDQQMVTQVRPCTATVRHGRDCRIVVSMREWDVMDQIGNCQGTANYGDCTA